MKKIFVKQYLIKNIFQESLQFVNVKYFKYIQEVNISKFMYEEIIFLFLHVI